MSFSNPFSGLFQAQYKSLAFRALLVMTLGLALTIAGFIELQQITKERLFLETEKNVRSHIEQIQTNINISLDSLTNVAALYQASGSDLSTRQLAQIFSTEAHYHSGTVGLAWIPRVSAAEKSRYEASVRRAGLSDYQIFEITGHGMPRPAGEQQDLFPVRALYPPLGTDLRLGLNLAAISTRQQVMNKAWQNHETAITDRVSIFSGDKHSYGFQAYHPVFETQDSAAIAGYVVGIYDLEGLFADVFANTDNVLTLYDSGSASQQLLYSSSADFSSVNTVKQSQQFHWSFPVQVADKQWIVSVFPQINHQQERTGLVPYMGLIAGSIITTLLTIYLVVYLLRSRQVSELSDNLEGTSNQLDIQRQLKLEADKANAAKSNLLRAASHDLRQPLHTVGLLTSLLKEADGNTQQQLAERIDQAVDNMGQLFGAILDISLLESGQQRINIKTFHIGDMLDRLFLDFELDTTRKALSLKMVHSDKRVVTDPALLERMLRNLLSNAVRYTEQGKVLLGCRRRGQFLRVIVADTGIGMTEDVQSRIADEFFRDEAAKRLADQGLGLGLAIVSKTAVALGLNFGFQSKPGQGSLFYIDVPLSSSEAFADEPEMVTDKAPLSANIWLIEDDEQSRFALEQHLKAWHCEFQSLSSAGEVSALLATSASKPDAIIADYNLGKDTGLALAEEIQAHFCQPTPLLIVTASAELENALSASALNPTMMLKPLKPASIYQWLQQQLV